MAKEANKEKKVKNEKDKKSFAKDLKAELKKVSWPTPKQLVNNTTAVIVIVLITAAIVFVLDVIFETLNNYGVEKLKAVVTSSSSENVNEVESDSNTTVDLTEAVENTNTTDENTVVDENTVEDTNTTTNTSSEEVKANQ